MRGASLSINARPPHHRICISVREIEPPPPRPPPEPDSRLCIGVLTVPLHPLTRRPGHVLGWTVSNVSGSSAARAGTGTRLDSPAAYEWPTVRPSEGQDARAHATLSPQSPSVRSGVVAPHDLDRGWVYARSGDPSVSEPSAARAGTGTLKASAVAHEWQSALTVNGGRMPKPVPSSQSPAPSAGSRALDSPDSGIGRARSPVSRSERQWAASITRRDRDPALLVSPTMNGCRV